MHREYIFTKIKGESWRDGLAVRSACWDLAEDLHPVPTPGNPMPSPHLQGHGSRVGIQRDTHVDINTNKSFNQEKKGVNMIFETQF